MSSKKYSMWLLVCILIGLIGIVVFAQDKPVPIPPVPVAGGMPQDGTGATGPAVTDLQRTQVQLVLTRIQLAQTKLDAAQAELDRAKQDAAQLIATMQKPGYDLDLQTPSGYVPKKVPPQVKSPK